MEEDQEKMRNWLRTFGAPESILQVDLSPMLRAEDGSIWRHLQRHVMSAEKVVEIRETILLDTLREKKILPGRFGKFKINSVEEMEKVVTYFEKKDEFAEKKVQIESVDSEIKSSGMTLIKNVSKCKSLSREIEEKTMKTQLLNRKVSQVKRNLNYINQQLEAVRFKSQSEANASMDGRMVEKLVCSIQLEDHDPEGIKYVLDSLRCIAPQTVLRGLERASRRALVTLVKMLNGTDSDIKTLEEKFQSKKFFSPEHHLSKLQEMYLESEIKLSNIQKDNDILVIQLNEERTALVEAIVESMGLNVSNIEENRSLVEEFVDVAVRKQLDISQVKKAKHLIKMDIHQMKKFDKEKIDLQEKYLKCQKLIEEKLVTLKALAAKIVQSDLIGTKNQVLEKCTAIAINCIDKQKQYKEDPFLVMSSLTFKELELLVKLPLKVITHSSEEDDYLPEEISQELNGQPSLLTLLQCQPKDALVRILEKITIGLS